MNNGEIEQTYGRGKKAEHSHSDTDAKLPQIYRPRRWLAVIVTVGLVIFAATGFGWVFWASGAFDNLSDGIKFVTEGAIAFALLLVAIVQACLFWSQRGIMNAQMEAAAIQARAMQQQEQAMFDAVDEQRKLVAQNERAVKAAEKNIKIVETADAPYFGIIGVSLRDFNTGFYPAVSITYFNGGKTPAWLFYPTASFIVGDDPDIGQIYPLRLKTTGIEASFFSSQGSHNFEFEQGGNPYFTYIHDFDTDDPPHLFLVTTIEYRGQDKESRFMTFRCIWYKGSFSSYDVAG